MIPAILDRLAAQAVTTPLTGGIVAGIDADPAAKVTMILFGPDGLPAAVAKAARAPSSAAALAAEHAALDELARLLPSAVGTDVPRVLLHDEVGGRRVLVTSALRGGPLSARYYSPGHVRSPQAVSRDLTMAADWLARFQTRTARGATTIGAAYATVVEPLLDRYAAQIGWGQAESSLRAEMEASAAALAAVPVALCAVHGDFAIGNVLVDGDAVSGVVDWELGAASGLPFGDLLKLAASYGAFLDRAAPSGRRGVPSHPGWAVARDRWGGASAWPNLVGILYAFAGEGWFPGLVREYLLAGYERLGVPADVESVFLPAFVAAQAMTLENPVYRDGYAAVFRALAGIVPTHRKAVVA